MALYSSTLAWKILWMEEPGGLQSMGSWRVRHDRAPSLSLFTFMHWRRKWQPTLVLLPGKFHGLRSLVGYSPWDPKELDMTERLHFHFHFRPTYHICWISFINWQHADMPSDLFLFWMTALVLSLDWAHETDILELSVQWEKQIINNTYYELRIVKK